MNTDEPTQQQQPSGPVRDFLTATRNEHAFREIRDKFPDFDLCDVPEADDAARSIWVLRCEHDAGAVQHGRPLDDVVADALRAIAEIDPSAPVALDWLTAPNATSYKQSDAPRVARRLVSQWQRPPQTQAQPRFVFVGAQHVKAQKPPRALIEGVLFENTGAELCGGQATFKSFVALSIAEAVASGADWHGRRTRKTPACYITGEGSAAIGQRIRAEEIHTGRSCEVQFLLEAVQLHRPEEVEALLLAIAQLPEKPGLIVVDTLARCFVGGDENSARDAGLFVAGVDRIRAATGATVLILHHINKSGDTRGSTAFAGAFDTMIEAKRENTIVSLKCLKQKDAPDFEAITLARRVVELDVEGEDGQPLTSLVFETTDAPEPTETPSKGDATRGKVLDVLRELCEQMPEGAPGQRFQVEAEARGIKRPTFIRHRDALRGTGEITFDGTRYQLKKESDF